MTQSMREIRSITNDIQERPRSLIHYPGEHTTTSYRVCDGLCGVDVVPYVGMFFWDLGGW